MNTVLPQKGQIVLPSAVRDQMDLQPGQDFEVLIDDEGRILSFNTSTAHVWEQLVASLEKKGTHLPTLDNQLAATAQRHGLTMVTWNVADFKNAGVKLINPFTA